MEKYFKWIPAFAGMTRKTFPAFAGMTILFFFSFFLMFHTFSYDAKKSSMLIATKAWSDFGSHIPLIRSFSLGDNFTRLTQGKAPEYPLFPGEPIRYHFLFYALVGFLEKLGVRIDWALNIPSALGFFFLLVMIWVLAKELFKDSRVALLSLIFFLFNGSLSFINFFKQHPLSVTTPLDIITNSRFPSFGPWDGSDITAFWTLNVYTNQRHLALSFALTIVALFFALKGKSGILIGFIFGILLFTNQAAAGIAALFLFWFFLTKKDSPRTLLIAGITTIPFLFLLTRLTTPPSAIAWQPGYLAPAPLTAVSFVKFWIANLGLHILFIPLGLAVAPRSVKKLLIVPLIVLFLLPSLFRFSPDIINNHKFFNFFLILGNMFSAYAVMRVFNWKFTKVHPGAGRSDKFKFFAEGAGRAAGERTDRKTSEFRRATSAPHLAELVGLVFLTLSGIIDFFPVLNDTKGSVPDIRANPDAQFFATQTQPDAVIANSTWFYHPASLAGRAIFNGYSYFTWSYGYDQTSREKDAVAVYQAKSRQDACTLLKQNNIAYLELANNPEPFLKPNETLWKSLPPVYQNSATGLSVYSTRTICP